MKFAISGANSSVGRNLLGHIAARSEFSAVSVVRSDRAAATLPAGPNLGWEVLDYSDAARLAAVFEGVSVLVHLAGVLFEGPGASYAEANVETTRAVASAAEAAGVEHVIFVSALGANAASVNGYYRSKGEAEAVVAAARSAATVLRTPMLLGSGSAAGDALMRMAQRSTVAMLGGGRQQLRPLDIDDLSRAILAAAARVPEVCVIHELAGPETVTYRRLLARLASRLGRDVRIVPVPVAPVRLAAAVGRRLFGRGMSPDVVDVITADETVARNADEALGIALTPLDATLAKLIEDR